MSARKRITMAEVFVDFSDLPKHEKADCQMILRCTQRERESIRQTAAELGQSVNSYLRLLHRLALKSVGREV